jgi:hypothetical protein
MPKGKKKAASRSSKAAAQDAEKAKKPRANYGRTGAVERVLIMIAGPKLLDYQGTMTSKDARFGDIHKLFVKALNSESTRLQQELQQAQQDSQAEDVRKISAMLAEVKTFVEVHVPHLDGDSIQLKLKTMTGKVRGPWANTTHCSTLWHQLQLQQLASPVAMSSRWIKCPAGVLALYVTLHVTCLTAYCHAAAAAAVAAAACST